MHRHKKNGKKLKLLFVSDCPGSRSGKNRLRKELCFLDQLFLHLSDLHKHLTTCSCLQLAWIHPSGDSDPAVDNLAIQLLVAVTTVHGSSAWRSSPFLETTQLRESDKCTGFRCVKFARERSFKCLQRCSLMQLNSCSLFGLLAFDWHLNALLHNLRRLRKCLNFPEKLCWQIQLCWQLNKIFSDHPGLPDDQGSKVKFWISARP